MRYVLLSAAIVAAAITFVTTPAWATPGAVRHYNWSSMSLSARIHAQRHLINDDWRVITTWRSSVRRVASVPMPYPIYWRYRHMKWTQRELRKSLRMQRASPSGPAGYPPHHALWVCISNFEGGDTSSNGTHFGKLQMTYDWMNVVPGKASDYSDAQQEWFAEIAWRENHYSYSFLYWQWYAYDNADGCGTTG